MKTFEKVLERFKAINFAEEFDMIVAIANGGIIPAAILNQRLKIDFQLLKIHLRDENQKTKYDTPQLMSPIDFKSESKKILLVDDRIKTGASIRFAQQLLNDAAMIKTFAVNGNADYALYNDACFRFPWIIQT
ncbi:MAG: phosphoribosyltransferase [Cytophagaceae bacterium]|jgi:xanthine phosphoribosyltransferase|nr:phosphoribosyltransferase [Cytophagaceae bacterium]